MHENHKTKLINTRQETKMNTFLFLYHTTNTNILQQSNTAIRRKNVGFKSTKQKKDNNHLKLGSVHFPLWSLQLESRPFVLDEMQNARYRILDILTRFVILFVIYTDSYLRSHLPSVVMRHGAIIHGCGDFHDMATITELVTDLSRTTMMNYAIWNTNTLFIYISTNIHVGDTI